MTPADRSASSRLRGLLRITHLVRSEAEIQALLQEIASTCAEALGFGVVVINLFRPEWDDFRVEAVHGSERALAALVGDVRGWDVWRAILDPRFERRGAYFVPHGTFDWSTMTPDAYIPEIEAQQDEGRWNPEDMLVAPMRHSDGHLLGILGVDEPAGGRLPDDDELDTLVAIAAHAALAIQSAQEAAGSRRHRESLEQLLQISSQLTETFSIEAILQSVCVGINRALGFGKLCVDLPRADGTLHPGAAVGWNLDDPTIDTGLTVDELRRMMDDDVEIEGCYLLTAQQAEERIDSRHVGHSSERSGRGSRAWFDHWLFVPLYGRGGEISGVIWADDPEDRLLPGPRTLQALRVFANQAATALDAASQFEEMRFLADHDPLTRLLNRRVFNERLAAEVARNVRYGRPLALVVCDLDGFKSLNDTLGHQAGDGALEAFGALLCEGRREVDSVYRIGGDEFALLLPEATSAEAQAVVDRVHEAMASSGDVRLEALGASFGIASCPSDGAEPDDLFRAADRAMYAIKNRGRSSAA